MDVTRRVRWAAPIALLACVAVATPALADFGPTRTVRTSASGTDLDLTDYAWDNGTIALTWEEFPPAGGRRVRLGWSTDRGTTWQHRQVSSFRSRDPQVAACSDFVWAIYRLQPDDVPSDVWMVALTGRSVDGSVVEGSLQTFGGQAREPDLACVGTRRLASAWFQKSGDTWRVKVHARPVLIDPKGDTVPEQSFDLGTGDESRGLAIAATKDMVYVAWFQGNALKLRRFSVGGSPGYLLSSLGTSTVATLAHGWSVELGAQASRVVLAYAQDSDVRIRRSTNEGASFGSAKTLVNNEAGGFASAWPTTVAVKGERMVVGVAEVVGDIGFSGAGFGFISTNGGSSWTRKPGHSNGVLVAGLVKVGSGYRYAEAWDQSLHDESNDPAVERVRSRRE